MSRNREKSQNNEVRNSLSTHLKDKQEKLEELITRLIEESAKGNPVVVEGKKDAKTLRELGVEGKIITVKTAGKSRLDVFSEIEQTGAREVILLPDGDRRGREWMSHLRQHLEKTGIKANASFWVELFALAGKELKDVEGLVSYMETLKSKLSSNS
jgi:2,5-diamino-6-(ribosylamino)-4(3H)-pyrimidinone 5'-phosphate reductase